MRVGVRVRVWGIRVRVRVRVEGEGENGGWEFQSRFSSKISPPQNCLLYTLYFFEFYNSYVLDLARFEDHTFAFFKGKC